MSKIRLVRREGGSKVLSISGIPDNWKAVELEIMNQSKKFIILKIKKVR